jgi:hypothetical protein
MRLVRIAGVTMLAISGVAIVIFGVDDLLMSAPPPAHQDSLSSLLDEARPEIDSLVLSMFDAQGGLFLGSGAALLLLLIGPVRRGDRYSLFAATAIATFGNGGVVLALSNMEAPFGIPFALLVIGVCGSILMFSATRAA